MPAAKPKMAAASFVVFVATPDGEIEQLNAATAREVTMPREKEEKGGGGRLPLLVIYVRRWQRSQAAHAAFAFAFALVCPPPFSSLPFPSLPPLLAFVPNENIRA